MECPGCKVKIQAPNCPILEQELVEARRIYEIVETKAINRAKHEGLDKDLRITNPDDVFYNDLKGYALFKLAFYSCFKCNMPYYGGMRDCLDAAQANQGDQNIKPEDLICGSCAALRLGAGLTECQTHGKDFIEFKCRYCCSVALWFCFGTTHFCEPCHQVANDSRKKECPGALNGCPLGLEHPGPGNEYALGCGLCRQSADQEPVDPNFKQPEKKKQANKFQMPKLPFFKKK